MLKPSCYIYIYIYMISKRNYVKSCGNVYPSISIGKQLGGDGTSATRARHDQ